MSAEAGSWKAMLEAIPRRNQAARVEDYGTGCLRLHVKNRRPWYCRTPPFSWIVPFRAERCYELDRLGSEIWELCDGRRRVEEIVDAFAATRRLTFHESRVSVTGYLRDLIRRGALGIEIDRSP